MIDQTKVVLYGVGAMGSLAARLLQSKPGVQIVGAIDRDQSKVGRDLGCVAGLDSDTGIIVGWPASEVLDSVEADVVLLTTTAFAIEAQPQLLELTERRLNVVSIVQELFFPLGKNVAIAKRINESAVENGVSVTSVGINPGFVMDIVPSVCSLPCWEVNGIVGRRKVDFSPYGPDEMVHIGANLTPEEFRSGVERGHIGHIGLLESSAFAAYCLGLKIDSLHQSKDPIISNRTRSTEFISIEPGKVCGFRQRVIGLRDGKQVLDLEMVGLLDPIDGEDGIELGDHTRISGIPNMDVRIKEQVSQLGGLGTAAVAVNTIPTLLKSAPGFHTSDRLLGHGTLPHIWREPPPVITEIYYY